MSRVDVRFGSGGPRGVRRVRRGRALVLAAVGAAVLIACAPPSPPPPVSADPQPPTVHGFDVVAARTEAPVTATFRWWVSDPDGDVPVCSLDLDGDGGVDRTIDPCPSRGDLLTQFVTPATFSPTITVSDGEHPPVTVAVASPLVVTAGPSEPFDITLSFDPGIDPAYRSAFEAAAQRWSEVIVDGWDPEQLDLPDGLLGWIPGHSGPVDDVLIAARVAPIDGPRGVLGRAGALGRRSSTGAPYFGVMEFDADDLQMFLDDGTLGDVILHEMGHVLGIGLNWAFEGRIDDLLANPTYNGPAAAAAWHELGGTGGVPVEDEGGLGTFGAHWRESTFDDELMTGYLDGGERLSRVTVGAFADRGDGVDLSAADPYVLPSTAAGRVAGDGDRVEMRTVEIPPLPEAALRSAGDLPG